FGFPTWSRLSTSKALLPGSIAVLAGSPGASKSLFVLEFLWRSLESGVKVSSMQLEKAAEFHLRRAVAPMSGCAGLTNDDWTRAHPGQARQIMNDMQARTQLLQRERIIQAPKQHDRPNAAFLLRWLKSEINRGVQVLVVDPVSNMSTDSNQRFLDEEK